MVEFLIVLYVVLRCSFIYAPLGCFEQVRMFGLLMVDIVLFLVIVVGSLEISDFTIRRMVVGFLSCAALISMFASPLFVIVSV